MSMRWLYTPKWTKRRRAVAGTSSHHSGCGPGGGDGGTSVGGGTLLPWGAEPGPVVVSAGEDEGRSGEVGSGREEQRREAAEDSPPVGSGAQTVRRRPRFAVASDPRHRTAKGHAAQSAARAW